MAVFGDVPQTLTTAAQIRKEGLQPSPDDSIPIRRRRPLGLGDEGTLAAGEDVTFETAVGA